MSMEPTAPTRKASADGVRLQQHIDENSSRAANGSNKMTDPPRSMKAALDAAAASKHGSTDNSSDTASEEDYDVLKYDPLTVIRGGKGGGFHLPGTLGPGAPTTSEDMKPASSVMGSPGSKVKNITVTLNKLKQEGRYVLTADDDALKGILREGIERENNPGAAKKRSKFSDLVFTRQFTVFDRQNASSAESPFRGFFTLFWLGVAIYTIKVAALNWQQYGHLLGTNEIMKLAFGRDVRILGLSDGVMCGSTVLCLLLQKGILKGWVNWNGMGWIIQSVWEFFFLAGSVYWTLFREWPWTHTVFFVLHALVMLMKQHSYAFYNGYLSERFKMRILLKQRLKQLEGLDPANRPSEKVPLDSLSTAYLDHPPSSPLTNQRYDAQEDGASNVRRISDVIVSGEALSMDQILISERIIKHEIDALSTDLLGKCTGRQNPYPNNLSLKNLLEFIILPTVVYELEYPRSDRIDWYYVAEKSVAVVCSLGIMNLISQTFIYPVVMQTVQMKEAGMPLRERLGFFPLIIADLIMPFMAEYMLTWYVIWECILNVLAELSYFADRGFYGDWWNSISWDQFSRDWNRPVYHFLLRHVYHSSISSLKVHKQTATLITFFLSACVHELLMWCLFKKLRGYMLFMQMTQLPLVQLSRTKWLKGRAVLGNLMLWVGLFMGPSLLCSLYLIL